MGATAYAAARILGVGESDLGVFPGRTREELQLQAIDAALGSADVDLAAIDGVAVSKGGDLRPGDAPAVELAELLGLTSRFIDTTLAGGAVR